MAFVSNNNTLHYEDQDICIVCFRQADFYSIGECDHPVCYECSTRMRVLCGRTECPTCRKDMALVVFTQKMQPFANIQYRNMQCEQRYKIYFENEHIMKAYDNLLQHSCNVCQGSPKFKTFNHLKEHMRKFHEEFYCDLCTDNLKIFTKERRHYNRGLLSYHRRKGDTDDKSHRGHPLCEFCDERFMDNDDLYRHLRRDHFCCHFCDADGQHSYYNFYNDLQTHFRQEHYLCEEGDCVNERFTSVFRTKLDFQAHIALSHSQNMSKSQARQARMVDIAFTVNHRSQGHISDRGRGNRGGADFTRGRGRGASNARPSQDVEDQSAAAAAIPPSEIIKQKGSIDVNSVQDFPSLHGGNLSSEGLGGNKSIAQKLAHQNRFTVRTGRGNVLSEEEFPSLSSTTASVSVSGATSSNPISASVHLSIDNQMSNNNVSIKCKSNVKKAPSENSGQNFTAKPRIGRITHSDNITIKGASNVLGDDFPSLGPSKYSLAESTAPTWVSNAKKKEPPKASSNNVPINRNNINFKPNDFPSLGASRADGQQHSLSYSGKNSLTIQVKKVNNNPKSNEKVINNPKSNENVKEKKKKKRNQGVTLENDNKSKKKNITLNNIFDDSDSEGPTENFDMKKQGDYEAIAPVRSSNVKLVSSNSIANNKKSELQLDDLQSTPQFQLAGEFPSLPIYKKGKNKMSNLINGNNSNSIGSNSSDNRDNQSRNNVPPGFSKKADKLYTSSQTVSLSSPKTSKKKNEINTPTFILPPDFENRNKTLISTINDRCKGNSEKFENFKHLAGLFRKDEITGKEYYERCQRVMGKKTFHIILSELLALLPDISKQQSVLEAYMDIDGGKGCGETFAVCAVCQQVLISSDFASHMNIHEAEFPTLNSVYR